VRYLFDRPAARLVGAVLLWACGPSEVAAAARERFAAGDAAPSVGPAAPALEENASA
jgi:hypothetical protein